MFGRLGRIRNAYLLKVKHYKKLGNVLQVPASIEMT